MRMSPDLDFKVDRLDRKDDNLLLSERERREKIASDELKSIINKQRITVEKNTRLYKAMK